MTSAAVVLAGGTGTRLYPASRTNRPKQFLALGGDRPLLERAVERARVADEVFVLTRREYADRVREMVPDAAVLVEPEPLDTGPALVYAVHRIREQLTDPVVLCLPSDHHVAGDFAGCATRAMRAARETGGLVTMGIDPDRPATGYGYLEPGPERDGYAPVERFHEKPDAETAREYVEAGYRWNAGIFAWTPEALLSAARDSELAGLVDALVAGAPERGFAETDAVSIDYAVLEDAQEVFVVPADFEWDDLGAWDALGRVVDTDERGNVALGEGLAVDASGNVLASDDKHLSVVGVDDIVVAAWDDRVLVVPRDEAERVREVVARLRERGAF